MSKLGNDIDQLYLTTNAPFRKAIKLRNQYYNASGRRSKSANLYYVQYLHYYQKALMYKWIRSALEVSHYQQIIIDKITSKVLIDDKAIKEIQDKLKKTVREMRELAESTDETQEVQNKGDE